MNQLYMCIWRGSMLSQADIVKKGPLRYKASKIKGTSGANIQGPKTYKDFYMVFRSVNGGHKVMECYQSERKFQEMVSPKLSVDLDEAISVEVLNERRNFFYIEMTDGVMCFFEAKTPGEAQEWKSCLNAVLLVRGPEGDGILQYEVDVLESEFLRYQGPAILELREKEGDLTVWTRDTHEQVVKWRLAHIRSFKAKKTTLTIYPGSRSSTGAKEFYFGCTNSVQVTHAIETIVAMVKTKKQRSRGIQDSHHAVSDRRPLPHLPPSLPPPPQSPLGVPELLEYSDGGDHPLNASIAANIPRFNPLDVYEDITDGDRAACVAQGGVEEYHKLDRTKKQPPVASKAAAAMPPPPEYGRLNVENHGGSSRVSPKIQRKRLDYEEIPDPIDSPDDYRKSPKLGRAISTPIVTGASNRMLDRQRSPVPGHRRHSPPQKPAPYQPKTSLNSSEEVYSQIDDNRPKIRPHTVRHRERSPMKASLSRSNSNPDLISKEEYRALDHFGPSDHPPAQAEEYGKLDHQVKKKVSVSPPTKGAQNEDYGKLGHVGRQPEEYGKLEHVAKQPEEYGKLEHVARQPEEYGKLEHVRSQSDEYGKLEHAVAGVTSRQQQDKYGKLGHTPENRIDFGKFEHAMHHQDEFGKFEHSPSPNHQPRHSVSPPRDQVRRSSFDPYGTLTAEDLNEEAKAANSLPNGRDKPTHLPIYTEVDLSPSGGAPIYSEVDTQRRASKKNREVSDHDSPAPPPGYENTELKKKETAAYKASYKATSTSPTAPPTTPPRTHAQKVKHGYVNVDGPLLPTERQHSGGANVNGHSEIVEMYDEIIPPAPTTTTPTFDTAPVPPRRGASVHNIEVDKSPPTARNSDRSPPTAKKPTTAPKPKVKPKPKQK